ncbi:hypothetical protein BVI434_150030 [Burkholderia vietnamiensis]|nr:hypothetical protein BVI434_150030 [Burkholderia vietnamiensis]
MPPAIRPRYALHAARLRRSADSTRFARDGPAAERGGNFPRGRAAGVGTPRGSQSADVVRPYFTMAKILAENDILPRTFTIIRRNNRY